MTCEEALAKLKQMFPKTACVAEMSYATYRQNNPICRLYISSGGPYNHSWGPNCASFEEAFTGLARAIFDTTQVEIT
jgi:hypothetical protein